MKAGYYYNTKIGRVGLIEEDHSLTNLFLPHEEIPDDIKIYETTFLKKVAGELDEYFNGTRTRFTVSCNPEGTIFQKEVWKALTHISYGKVASYKDISNAIGKKQASRAIGNANHHNPIPIIIPCHRVVMHNGLLGGYGGGIPLKIKLLNQEGIKIQDSRINM